MKKLLIVLLVMIMICIFTACNGNNSNQAGDDSNDDIFTQEDIDDLGDALDILESLKPEGWDENRYGAYIYDVYDSDFLPECFPEQIEGTKAYSTNFKDYNHDTLNGSYDVGYINYESYEDYREYSVSFYATKEQLYEYVNALHAKGIYGSIEFSDDYWSDGFFAGNGWAMELFFNPNDNEDGTYYGCLHVSATNDLFDLPKSISGTLLPQVGIVTFDHQYYTIQDFSEGYEDIDFNLEKDAFPTEYFAAWFDYYGVTKQNVIDYVEMLTNNGWVHEYDYGEDADLYIKVLKKDGIYAYCNYEDNYLCIGFSDMIENLTY